MADAMQLPWTRFAPGLLVLATLFTYSDVAWFDFVNYDDPLLIKNPAILDGITVEGLRSIVETPIQGNWTPVAWLSHMVDIELFGMNAGGHHVTSLALHVLAVLLLFFGWRSKRGEEEAFFISALLAIHPVHVESVAWLSERRDTLSMVSFVGILCIWMHDGARESAAGRVGSLVLLVFGLLSKSTLVTVPAVLLLLDVLVLKRPVPPLRLIAEKIPMFAAALLVAAFTAAAQDPTRIDSTNVAYRSTMIFVAYAKYIELFAIPHDLACLYLRPVSWKLVDIASASVTYIVFLSALARALMKTRDWTLVAGLLWFLGTLVPMIGFLQVGLQAYADRYLYVSSIGLSLCIWGILGLLGHLRLPLVAVWLIWLTVGAKFQTAVWENRGTLWANTLEAGHPSSNTYRMRSAEFAEKRQYADALFNTRIALVYEDNEHIALQIGFLEYKLGEFADAHMSLINAAERNPEVPLPFYWLGRVYEASNDHKRALNAYTVAHKIGLRGASLDLAIARSAIKTGDTETAEKHESTLAEGAAASPTAFGFFYAQLAWEQQRSDIAARRLDSVLSVAPTLVDALVFRLLLELQNPDGEVEIARDLLSKLSEAEGHGARWAVASILASHRFSLTLETTPQASVEAYRDAEWRLLLDDLRVLGGASMDREIVPNLIDRSLEVTMANVLFEAEPLPKRD